MMWYIVSALCYIAIPWYSDWVFSVFCFVTEHERSPWSFAVTCLMEVMRIGQLMNSSFQTSKINHCGFIILLNYSWVPMDYAYIIVLIIYFCDRTVYIWTDEKKFCRMQVTVSLGKCVSLLVCVDIYSSNCWTLQKLYSWHFLVLFTINYFIQRLLWFSCDVECVHLSLVLQNILFNIPLQYLTISFDSFSVVHTLLQWIAVIPVQIRIKKNLELLFL